MKKLFHLLILASTVASQYVHADEFNHDGIRIIIPGVTSEKQLVRSKPGSSAYLVTQKDVSDTSQTLVETYIQVEASDSYQKYGAEEGAAWCLSLVRMHIPGKALKELNFPRSVLISGRKAMSFTMTHNGTYSSDTWRGDMVNVAVYCIVEPTRQIQIEVIGSSNVAQDAFARTVSGIEKMEITSD